MLSIPPASREDDELSPCQLPAASRAGNNSNPVNSSLSPLTQLVENNSFRVFPRRAPATPGEPIDQRPEGQGSPPLARWTCPRPHTGSPGTSSSFPTGQSRGTAGERRSDGGAAGATLDGPESSDRTSLPLVHQEERSDRLGDLLAHFPGDSRRGPRERSDRRDGHPAGVSRRQLGPNAVRASIPWSAVGYEGFTPRS
jgi:hypothetical protein